METAGDAQTVRRVSLRLLPLLLLLYIFAYLDRINVGIAALEMNGDLGFGPAVFGFGAGIFFLGYALFEVPSNLILARVGARRWIARIAITWGLLACAMMLVRTPVQFYAVRFLLGVAEAGLFPGVIYYLSHWFPANYRARAMSGFAIAIPVSQAIGGPVGGLLLAMSGFGGLRGWQWLFLIEGLPSVLLGLFALRYLTDGPAEAAWLTPAERAALAARLERERPAGAEHGGPPLKVLLNPRVWVLAAVWFAYYTVALALTVWTPTLVREALHTSPSTTAVIAGGIALCGALAFPLAGMLSDWWRERAGLTAIGLALAAAACVGVALLPPTAVRIAALVAMPLGTAVVLTSFWCLPTAFLTGPSAAVGIALVSAIGSSGGFFGPNIIGVVRSLTGSDTGALFALAGLALVGAAVCLGLRRAAALRSTPAA